MLLGNYAVTLKSPGRFFSGGSTAGTNQAQARSNWGRHGPGRGVHYQDGYTTAKPLWGAPTGGYGALAWMMPYQQGELDSYREADFSVSADGLALAGFPIDGDISFSVDAADVAGQLISSGNGSTSFSVSAASSLLTASVNGEGAASIWFSSSTSTLGAIASLTVDASFSVSSTATLTAIGIMEGSTVDTTGMTPVTVAAAVWGASSSEYDESGTMGQKLNAAGTAGDPWTADLSGYASGTAGQKLQSVPNLGKLLALLGG